ncbi:polymer-forming cytoskeletal protein [Altererythrobacter confluentis]|uniref:Polymer-forming cytoskeletal protein n=2 Tax=Allopontixanthobacter confluentis TaxID=1849021 RepID=A0A6L7GI11_9SPHN|nr:polymer-forming cytoskeletal protein [Allopontixanthobacter confluentis]
MFSKKPDQAPRASMASKPMANGSSTFSVIGSDVTIKGNISASTELHVDGRIEGDIRCASLVQGEGSVVHGAIEAESARLSGTVVGSISARELVVLRSARIEGDVHYDALTIEQGAEVEGRFAHRVPEHRDVDQTAGDKAASAEGEPKLTLAS